MEDALALYLQVEVADVDEFRPGAVGRSGDRAAQRLLPRLTTHADDLARLHVGPEADDEIGEPLEQAVVDGGHRAQVRRSRWRL